MNTNLNLNALRDYQINAVDTFFVKMHTSSQNNICFDMPAGSGKSWVIAAICAKMFESRPEARILVLAPRKELIQQDADKILRVWPDAPIGIYCAGLNSRDMDSITVALINSIYQHVAELGHIDLVVVDEAHLIGPNTKMYQQALKDLRAINPDLYCVGLTATPYRLGMGRIDQGPDALFAECIKPVTIENLIQAGFLVSLQSQFPNFNYDISGVSRMYNGRGDYVESELQAKVNTTTNNGLAAQEILRLGGNRKAWLIFCVGIEHAYAMRDELRRQGINAETVTGKTPAGERADILERFKRGEVRAITNANILTTGFDYPGIDLIALCRPTMSCALYVQMAGRGMRTAEGKVNCLVLDFVGAIAQHGPITNIKVPENTISNSTQNDSESSGNSGVSLRSRGEVDLLLQNDDIMGGKHLLDPRRPRLIDIRGWFWEVILSPETGYPLFQVYFYPRDKNSKPISVIYNPNYSEDFGDSTELNGKKPVAMVAAMLKFNVTFWTADCLKEKKFLDEAISSMRHFADRVNDHWYFPEKIMCLLDPDGHAKISGYYWLNLPNRDEYLPYQFTEKAV